MTNTFVLHEKKSRLYTVERIGIRVATLAEAPFDLRCIDSLADAEKFFREVVEHDPEYEPDQEQLVACYLDTRMTIRHWRRTALGDVRSVTYSAPDICRPAIVLGVRNIIIMHNHPSGSADPSQEDIRMTQHLATATRALGLTLLDSIVVGDKQSVSLREMGYIE